MGIMREKIRRLLVQAWLLATLLATSSFAIKPLRNLQVVCRNHVYVISDVDTVEELVNRLQKDSGISSNDIQSCRVIHKGNVLERTQSLRKAGVQDGASVIVVTDNYQLKGKEALAIFLEMINEENWVRLRNQMKDDENFDFSNMRDLWKDTQYVKRHEVSHAVRNLFDTSYRVLRGGWEHPAFRRALHDAEKIEAYRVVIDKHLSKKILNDIPGAKALVENSDAWRQQIFKVTAVVLRAGDVILDGLLDVLLDVLKGAGKNKFGSEYTHTTASPFPVESQINPAVEDPFMASDLLFELSESEDED